MDILETELVKTIPDTDFGDVNVYLERNLTTGEFSLFMNSTDPVLTRVEINLDLFVWPRDAEQAAIEVANLTKLKAEFLLDDHVNEISETEALKRMD